MFGAKAEIALLEKGLAFERVAVAFDANDRYEPKHPEVLRVNPKRQVPVLIHGEVEVFDSTQIFEYLEDRWPEPPLWPKDPAGRTEARQLELKSDEVYFPHVIRLMGLEAMPDDPAAVAAREAAARFTAVMEARLQTRDYLAGDFSYADIAFFMAALFGERKGAPLTATTPRLIAWRERMLARPAVRQVAGAMGAWLAERNRPVPAFLVADLRPLSPSGRGLQPYHAVIPTLISTKATSECI
jgi:glutathione S-transferase